MQGFLPARAFPRGLPNTLRPMLYRILHGIVKIYAPVWFAIFLGLAAIAMLFTVIYPLVPIVLIISSVFLVVGVRCGYLVLKWLELKLAMEKLSVGLCPACGARCDAIRIGERRVQECPGCRQAYDEKGDHYAPQPGDAEKSADFERTAEVA